MKNLFKMFITFFKIGAFTFGGGYAMIPLIEAEVVEKNNWVTKEEFMDMIVISQTFPGALAVNSCLFIGYKIGGIMGAILGVLGVILPSFFIIIAIASLFMRFRNNQYVDLAFNGIRAAVPMLVFTAVISLSKSVKKEWTNLFITLSALVSILFFNVHPVIVIICSGLYGIIFLRKKVD